MAAETNERSRPSRFRGNAVQSVATRTAVNFSGTIFRCSRISGLTAAATGGVRTQLAANGRHYGAPPPPPLTLRCCRWVRPRPRRRRATARAPAACCCGGWAGGSRPEQSRTAPTTPRSPSCSPSNRCTLDVAAAGSGTEGRGRVRTERLDRAASALETEEVETRRETC